MDALDTDSVVDCESFLVFVRALIADRRASLAAEQSSPSSPYGPDAGGWENITIESFLFAALRWAEGRTEFNDLASPEILWRGFARFLIMGKLYE